MVTPAVAEATRNIAQNFKYYAVCSIADPGSK